MRNANPLPAPLARWLLAAARADLTTVERAVLLVLLERPRWTLDNWADLWRPFRFDDNTRQQEVNNLRLPYSEQGIRKACNALVVKRCIRLVYVGRRNWGSRVEPEVVLEARPPVLEDPRETHGAASSAPVVSPAGSGARNARRPRSRAPAVSRRPREGARHG